jgi:hypothetical protein
VSAVQKMDAVAFHRPLQLGPGPSWREAGRQGSDARRP